MATFKHKDIEINLLDSGKFCFTLHGNEIECTSLAAAKKRIDGAVNTTFKPFTVLQTYGERRTVIKIMVNKRRTYNTSQKMFVMKGEYYPREQAYEDTPANETLLRELKDHRTESSRIADERRKVERKIESRLAVIKADDFNIDGTRKEVN